MSLFRKRITININSLYYISLVIATVKFFIPYSEIITIPNIINNMLTLLFLANMSCVILIDFFNSNKIYKFLIVLIIIIMAYTGTVSNNYVFWFSGIMLLEIRNIKLEKIVRILFTTKVILLIFHFLIFLIYTYIFSVDMSVNMDGVIRNKMLLSQPNTAAMLYLGVLLEFYYLYGRKKNNQITITKIVMNIWIIVALLYTKSKTSQFLYIVFVLLWNIRNKKILGKILHMMMNILPMIFLVSTYFCTKYYTISKMVKTINGLFTGRIAGAAKAYSLYGVTLFGQDVQILGKHIDWDPIYGVNYVWLENLYSMYLISTGVIYIIFIILLMIFLNKKFTLEECIFITITYIYGLTEIYAMNTFLFFPFFIIFDKLYKERIYNRKR